MPGISTQSFELTGGRLCLDFANTVDDRPTNHPKDRLHGYEDFIGFGMQTGILSRAEVRELTGMVKRHRRTGARLYREEIALRETIFRIFAAAANNRRPTLKDLLALNHVAHLLGRCALVLPLLTRAPEAVIEDLALQNVVVVSRLITRRRNDVIRIIVRE